MKRAALVLVLLAACHLTDPEVATGRPTVIPVNAREMEPWRERFVPWAEEVGACLGLEVDGVAVVDAIRWATVDEIAVYPPVGAVAGWYIPAADGGPLVYLVTGAQYTEFAVKHELMHHLIDDPGHRDPRWGRCTGGGA